MNYNQNSGVASLVRLSDGTTYIPQFNNWEIDVEDVRFQEMIYGFLEEQAILFCKECTKPSHEITPPEYGIRIRNIRIKLPSLHSDSVVQKIIPDRYWPGILEFHSTAGFMARWIDAVALENPSEIIKGLGLTYQDSPYLDSYGEPKSVVYAIRFRVNRLESDIGDVYHIPFGGQNEDGVKIMGGGIIKGEPFLGTGFTPHPDPVIPEYLVDHDHAVIFTEGTEIYKIEAGKGEVLVAVYKYDEDLDEHYFFEVQGGV